MKNRSYKCRHAINSRCYVDFLYHTDISAAKHLAKGCQCEFTAHDKISYLSEHFLVVRRSFAFESSDSTGVLLLECSGIARIISPGYDVDLIVYIDVKVVSILTSSEHVGTNMLLMLFPLT